MRLSPLMTDLTFAWLRTMLLYRAGGTFGRCFFPRDCGGFSGLVPGLGKGSIKLAEFAEFCEIFEDPEKARVWPVAYPILCVLTPMMVVEVNGGEIADQLPRPEQEEKSECGCAD